MKKVLQVSFSCILTLFLSLLLLAGTAIDLAKGTVCRPQYLVDIADKSTYAQELYEEIRYEWENLLAITGVTEPTPIMAVLTPERVREDALQYLEDAYTGSPQLSTDALKQELEAEVRRYVNSNYIPLEQRDELEQNITDLVSSCISHYRSSIMLPAAGKILGAVKGIEKYIRPGLHIAAGGAAVLVIFLFFLQRKRRNLFYYAAIAGATDAVLLYSVPELVKHYEIMERLPFGESAMKTLILRYLEDLVGKVKAFGRVFLKATVAAVLAFLLLTLLYWAFVLFRFLWRKRKKPTEAPKTE